MGDGTAVRAAEIAEEQRHVDRVYERLEVLRAETVAATRSGYRMAGVGNLSALVERDAMVYQLARRLRAMDAEYDGLVFGRLDLGGEQEDGSLHIGRLGLRDERYRSLVVDWRAPAAAAFYRATPADRMGVVRRRTIRCSGARVVDVQDDLLDTGDGGSGLTVVGEGALLASLSRATGHRMRDIVATIAREQDEAVRAPAFGAALITGGPGTGKTAVALHRAAYLLYSDRNRYESRGVLIVGPSPVFMRYIERVLPGLGEESVTLRSLGELFDGLSAARYDEPAVAAVKGSLRMRQVLRRAVRDAPPTAPDTLRITYAGLVLTLDAAALAGVRRTVHRRGALPNRARRYVRAELLTALWREAQRVGGDDYRFDRQAFADEILERTEFRRFMTAWWPVLTPVEVLSWLGDEQRLRRYAGRVLDRDEVRLVAASMADEPSVADVALADELRVLLGEPPEPPRRKTDPDDAMLELAMYADRARNLDGGAFDVGDGVEDEETEDWERAILERATAIGADRPVERREERPPQYDEYAHVVVDEAQDLSPMQWRMLGRRGRYASWTIVGDPAQSAWPDPAEAVKARDEALHGTRQYRYELRTNYRNSAEIFELAARVVATAEPDLELPTAVRHTGLAPEVREIGELARSVRDAAAELLAAVDGTIGVVVPAGLRAAVDGWLPPHDDRLQILEPLATKGMEYDAVLVLEPARIVAETAGAARTLYVVLTRATQRLTVLSTVPWPE
jgi:AAA domain-containing protein